MRAAEDLETTQPQAVAYIVNTCYTHDGESSQDTRLREKDVVIGGPAGSAQDRGDDASRLEVSAMEGEPMRELKWKLEVLGMASVPHDRSSRPTLRRAVTCIQNAADRWRRRKPVDISPDLTAGRIEWRCDPRRRPDQASSKRHSFVLLCIPFMRWGTKAHQPDVCAVRSDQAFFRLLRASHAAYRTQHLWSRLKRLVSISQSPFLPVGAGFDHESAETEPPVGANLMMHLFENPDHADILPVLFRRIPRKTRARLEACPVKGSSVGWGVQYVEAPDGLYVFVFGCLGFLGCLAVSVAWTVVKHDIQGGFAIGGFALAFVIFCGGMLHSYAA
ncbi:hypothetical protein LX32DRAFT_603295 [Colletotrichum zoysiae]|uniref:Uncharacterized protein n=1 Tax=Colletotrichum zoysiae TaxID=1216348 RepID=A0AAD9LXY5_9PEZI|nr:hypothetical protein LX32DRAFT_603295 [Colletotrichum zoysiae]